MTPLEIDTDISIKDERWNSAIRDIQPHIRYILPRIFNGRTGGKLRHIEISIVLANDAFIQILNRDYRKKNTPTNVLSFPMSTPEDIEMPLSTFCPLGDIIFSYETILKESAEQQKTVKNHFTHMLVHGCLHLLHYDHENDDDAKKMEELEIKILARFGIKNPYELQ